MKLASLAAVLALAAAQQPADAKCAMAQNVPVILTPRDAEIPPDGGVVVGYQSKMLDAPYDDHGDASIHDTYRFEDGKVLLAANRIALAPGLSLYVPASRPAGNVRLVDLETGGRAHELASYKKTTAARAPMVPPQIGMVMTMNTFRGPRRVQVTLAVNAPSNAIALVLYKATPHGHGAALGYGRPGASRTFEVVAGGHCEIVPTGTTAPEPGETVVLAWVDGSGHLSELSKPTTVAGEGPGAD